MYVWVPWVPYHELRIAMSFSLCILFISFLLLLLFTSCLLLIIRSNTQTVIGFSFEGRIIKPGEYSFIQHRKPQRNQSMNSCTEIVSEQGKEVFYQLNGKIWNSCSFNTARLRDIRQVPDGIRRPLSSLQPSNTDSSSTTTNWDTSGTPISSQGNFDSGFIWCQLLYLFECTWFVLVMKLNSVFAHPFFLTIKCNNGGRGRLFWHIYFPFSLKSECHKRSLTRDTGDYEFRACACISLALMPLTKVRDHPQSTDLSIMRAQYSSPPISQNRRLSVSGRHLTDVNLNLWPKSEISENDSLPEDNIAHQIFWQIRSNNRSWKKFSICLCFCGCIHWPSF